MNNLKPTIPIIAILYVLANILGLFRNFFTENSYIKFIFKELIDGNFYNINSHFFRMVLGWIILVILIMGIIKYFKSDNKIINRLLEFGLMYSVMNTILYAPITISRFLGYNSFGDQKFSIIWYIQSFTFLIAAIIVCIYFAKQIKTFQKPAFGPREKSYGPTPFEQYLESDKIASSKGLRFKNYLIDSFFIYIMAFGAIAQYITYFSMASLSGLGNSIGIQLVFIFALWIYYLLMEAIFGKTLGKIITGSAVQFYGKSSFAGALGRSFCRFIPFDALSYLFKNGYGWHDQFSKTTVELLTQTSVIDDSDHTKHLIEG